MTCQWSECRLRGLQHWGPCHTGLLVGDQVEVQAASRAGWQEGRLERICTPGVVPFPWNEATDGTQPHADESFVVSLAEGGFRWVTAEGVRRAGRAPATPRRECA